jgi:hypothetical protein
VSPPPDDTKPPYPDDPFWTDDSDDPRSSRGGASGILPDFVKNMALAGLGAIFMTEEGIRGLAGQMKLPKEALQFVVGQAQKTRDDLGRVVSEEIRRFLQSETLRQEFLKLISGMTMEIRAEVRLKPDPDRAGESETSVDVAEIKFRQTKKKDE